MNPPDFGYSKPNFPRRPSQLAIRLRNRQKYLSPQNCNRSGIRSTTHLRTKQNTKWSVPARKRKRDQQRLTSKNSDSRIDGEFDYYFIGGVQGTAINPVF